MKTLVLGAVTKRDASALQVIRRELNGHRVSENDFDEELPHLAGDMRQDHMIVFQFYAEEGVGEHFDDLAGHLNCIAVRTLVWG